MNHLLMTLPFIIYNLVIILLLAHSDPRRRQLYSKVDAKSKVKISLSARSRQLLAWSLLLPFLPLVVMANYAGVLMYASALTVGGWLVAELPASVV